MKKIVLCYLLLSYCSLFGQSPLYNYINAKNRILKINSLKDHNEYPEIFKILDTISKYPIPLDFTTSYFADYSEYYLYNGDKENCLINAKKGIESGLDTMWLYDLSLNYSSTASNTEIVKDIRKNYPEWRKDYESKINWSFRKEADAMYDSDQVPRNLLHNAYNVKDTNSIKIIWKKLGHLDSINQKIFDSLCDKYGWISQTMIGRSKRYYQIILAHASNEMRYKYVSKGFELCKENKITWMEVIRTERYSFHNSKGVNTFIGNLQIIPSKNNQSEFNEFIIYCLAMELTNDGTYMGNDKKIQLKMNIRDMSIDTATILTELTKMKKILVKFNVPESEILIDSSDYITHDNSIDNYIVDIKFL